MPMMHKKDHGNLNHSYYFLLMLDTYKNYFHHDKRRYHLGIKLDTFSCSWNWLLETAQLQQQNKLNIYLDNQKKYLLHSFCHMAALQALLYLMDIYIY